jgi:hypothetical protein
MLSNIGYVSAGDSDVGFSRSTKPPYFNGQKSSTMYELETVQRASVDVKSRENLIYLRMV